MTSSEAMSLYGNLQKSIIGLRLLALSVRDSDMQADSKGNACMRLMEAQRLLNQLEKIIESDQGFKAARTAAEHSIRMNTLN